MDYYKELGLRSRILTLPLMVAAVITILWRQVPSVHELGRMIRREDLLWSKAVRVSQQALSERFLTFPAKLLERILKAVLPKLKSRWQARQKRPLPGAVNQARQHFGEIWVVDGSTLEALFRKLDILKSVPVGQLAGKICAVLDVVTRLPVEVWFCEKATASDTNFMPQILALAQDKVLLLFDRGFYDFSFFAALIKQGTAFITRLKSNAVYQVEQVLTQTENIKDRIILLGSGEKGTPQVKVRLVEVRFGLVWYSYITSVLDPTILPPCVIADLYRYRWRIEEVFNVLKRLLNLAYLWTGSINGILLQIWASWLFYAILVDLGDDVADALALPYDRISLELLFRGLYHFSRAFEQGLATDPVSFFADSDNQDLRIVKPPPPSAPPLDYSAYPT